LTKVPVVASNTLFRNRLGNSYLLLQRLDSALSSPVFGRTEAAYTSVIKRTLSLLARALSLPFAGNFADTLTGIVKLMRFAFSLAWFDHMPEREYRFGYEIKDLERNPA
jgi:hypothetical protein